VRLEGVIPPITTPFDESSISAQRLRENVERYEGVGVDGYLLLGSSGEAALLDEEEKLQLLRSARSAVPDGKPLIAGVGMESTAATIRLARLAADCGADLVLVLTPHYFGRQMNASALEAHYRWVADASPLPLLLYDVPKFTHVQIPTDAVLMLSRHERIVGIKDSSGDLARLLELSAAVPREFAVICGNHDIFLAALSEGARGGILAAADPFPATYVRIHRLAREGDSDAAEALMRRVSAASRLAVSRLGVPGIKAAMDLCGLYGGPPRPPLQPITEEARNELRREIDTLREAGALDAP
jgi:4-hydroxy-2-oxoglutarate aldolase